MKSHTAHRRLLCLWFPDWPVQRLAAARPGLDRCVLLLTESTSRGEFVRGSNALARRRGVRDGMPVCEARTLAAGDPLVAEELRPDLDRQALEAIALRCERFSFCIGPEEAERPESLLMDVTGVGHLFGDEDRLAGELWHRLREHRFDGRVAVADTVGAAWAAARFLASRTGPFVMAAGTIDPVRPLPVEGLRLAAPVAAKLGRLGVRTIGQLLALDRPSLLRRFGDDALRRIDQLTGLRPEAILPCRPLPRYVAERHLDEGIARPDRVEHLWSSLLQELLEQLRPPRFGTRHLRAEFRFEDRTGQVFDLRLCEATGDPRHLGDLLRLKLEKLRIPSPLVGLHLEALEVGPLEATQHDFFDGASHDEAREFSRLLNRLGSRLGEAAVVVPRLLPDPVPERSVAFQPVTAAEPPPATFTARFLMLDRPTVLFPEPRPVEVVAPTPDGPPAVVFWKTFRFDVESHWGPERIESGWWEGEYVRRDYYRVEAKTGERLWVFRLLPDRGWFWHGEL